MSDEKPILSPEAIRNIRLVFARMQDALNVDSVDALAESLRQLRHSSSCGPKKIIFKEKCDESNR